MDRTLGQITMVIIAMVALGSGAIAIDLQGIARIGLGGWNGFVLSGTEAEAIVCRRNGNCTVPGAE